VSRVEIRELGKFYGGLHVIEGLNLTIAEGEFFVLLGPSGCGKTTTLRCVAGLETPSRGTISIGDVVVADPARNIFVPPARRNIGMVFQSYALWPHMTVFANLAYPLKIRRMASEQCRARVAEVLSIVGLSGYERRYPSELSGGQQQRVALARAIAGNPNVVLFDEPLSNLDAQLRQRLRDDLRRLHEQARRTALYVTHDQSEALVLADRIAVMNHGFIEQVGSAEDIFRRPATRFVAEFVGFENYVPGEIAIGGKHPSVRIPDWNVQLKISTDNHWNTGERVSVACRPSALSAVDSALDKDGGPLVAGRIVSAVYMGESYLFTVRVGNSTVRALSRTGLSHEARSRGQPVALRIAEPELILIEAANSRTAGMAETKG